MEALSHRAILTYHRANPDGPRPEHAVVTQLDGRGYVILRTADHGLLAVYRVKADGGLRRMVRPPIEVLQAGTAR